MLKIGITGGIGSGKTTVCEIFSALNIPVFYADTEAKKVMTADSVLVNDIKELFGNNAYDKAGYLNRKYIADQVFDNETRLKQLNSLVHPAVFRAFDHWIQTVKAPYILKEAALLFESDSYQSCDFTIAVSAPFEARIARVMHRDNVSREQVLARSKNQMDDDLKTAKADFVIYNSGTELLIPQVLSLHERFLAVNSHS
jgi:dephospho-CoA kinase